MSPSLFRSAVRLLTGELPELCRLRSMPVQCLLRRAARVTDGPGVGDTPPGPDGIPYKLWGSIPEAEEATLRSAPAPAAAIACAAAVAIQAF